MYLEPPVILGHRVCKINLLSLAHKLLEFRVLFHPYVVPDEVPVNTVSPPLLLVQQEVRGCNSQKGREGGRISPREGGKCSVWKDTEKLEMNVRF